MYYLSGYFVNWWQVTPYMILMPTKLKKLWQERLRLLVQAWIGGIPLENTDIYGIRRYQDGARLLTHTDRESTHAASLIINVDQQDMREDWPVEIYDFAGRLHEISMAPGEIIYYESARCLHGRMRPLRGAHYSNIFAHYRPLNDPDWFKKSNPPSGVQPLIDIGECAAASGGGDLDDSDSSPGTCRYPNLPYLSPAREVVHSGNDLFDYWRRIGVETVLETSSIGKAAVNSDLIKTRQHAEL